MSKICCLPNCKNRTPTFSLFHVPSKHVCKRDLFRWAEEFEKLILGLRCDVHIKQLYQRDVVKICERHFPKSDIIMRGNRKEHGAIPTLRLPKKQASVLKKRVRPFTRQRANLTKSHFNSVESLAKLRNSFIPCVSIKYPKDNSATPTYDGRDQIKFQVHIPHTISVCSQSLENKDKQDEESRTDPIPISIKEEVTDEMPSCNEGPEVDEATDNVLDSLEDENEEEEDSDTDQILRSIMKEGADEIPSLSESSESEENDQEDSDIDQILRTIKEEGEKDRQTTMQAVQVLANAMKESIDKLICSRELT